MEKIASFKVNHLNLFPGLYVSRRDKVGEEIVTTFDMRVISPNREEVMDTGSIHTIEHLGATYLRNSHIKDEVIYFGPMGCRTGFYIVLAGELDGKDIADIILDMCDFIVGFEGEIPGAKPEECGNFSDQNLGGAKEFIKKYKKELTTHGRFEY